MNYNDNDAFYPRSLRGNQQNVLVCKRNRNRTPDTAFQRKYHCCTAYVIQNKPNARNYGVFYVDDRSGRDRGQISLSNYATNKKSYIRLCDLKRSANVLKSFTAQPRLTCCLIAKTTVCILFSKVMT